MKNCRHCHTRPAFRARGLCWGCYEVGSIRKLYPPSTHNPGRGPVDITGGTTLPAEPTDAMPGSERKISVMEKRAEKRVCLFHPEDISPRNAEAWRNFISSLCA